MRPELPDIPRWVQARAYLALPGHEVRGPPDACAVLFDDTVVVVGRPSRGVLHAAIERAGQGVEVIVPAEDGDAVAAALPELVRRPATLFELPDATRVAAIDVAGARIVAIEELRAASLPEELLAELEDAARYVEIAASFVGARPVAFCYAGTTTDRLWDVAIDTLEPHRREGHAARAFAFLEARLRARGKAPVWGAIEGNVASSRLAQKLGFVPVDTLAVFSRS